MDWNATLSFDNPERKVQNYNTIVFIKSQLLIDNGIVKMDFLEGEHMLNRRIHDLRGAFGWSQVELAKQLNVSKQTVSNWENDNIQPSIDMLVRLSRIFGVSTDYLLGLEEIPRLDVGGLSDEVVAHLALLIADYRGKQP